ncbi:TBC domain containing protein [Cryptosporidium ryanae]|uniref:TBC domain containing protein n=1 Tax=Cryptosporidium ryanae TaxID=515981 RepID=UPI00351AA854|nr:TBC domain containing protein [Cryptosporidium ryanae]
MLGFRLFKVEHKGDNFNIELFKINEKPDKCEFNSEKNDEGMNMNNYFEISPLDFSIRKYSKFIYSRQVAGKTDADFKTDKYSKRGSIYNKLFERKFIISLREANVGINNKLRLWMNYKFFDVEKLKRLCIYGIPYEIRGEIWCHLLGSKKMLLCNLNKYKKEVSEFVDKEIENQINLDLNRTFTNVILDKDANDSEIVMELYRVLKAFSSFDSKIGYCQSLNFIAAILLVNMKEELAFWTLVQLISHKRNEDFMICNWSNLENYYKDGMEGIICDMKVLKQLCKSMIPKVHERFEYFGIDIQWFAIEWFLCLFVTTFPNIAAMRLLDFIFCFGSCSLFSISIALLDINKNRIISSNDMEECINAIKSVGKYSKDPQQIIQKAMKYNIRESYIRFQRSKIILN